MSCDDAEGPASPDTAIKAFMRLQPLFADLNEDDLDRLVGMATLLELAVDDLLVEEGAAGDDMFIILEGELEVFRGSGAQRRALALRTEGEVVGEMAPLGNSVRTASVRALTPCRLLAIGREALETLLSCSPHAAMAMVRTVTTRLRSAEAMLVQQEKLAGLGTMAAGLAHELNNPAAAIARATSQLLGTLGSWSESLTELGRAGLDASQARALAELTGATGGDGSAPPPSSPLEAMDLEDALATALEGAGADDPFGAAPVLLAAGWRAEDVEARLAPFGPALAPAAVRAVAAAAEVRQLLREAGAGAAAISAIVKSVKSYTYLDQAPVQEIDVHEGLETTLTMLHHKLKEGIVVERAFDPSLPRIGAHGSELNQVWTNIIDNAADAMNGHGTLSLRTYAEDDRVVVEICDDGPGMPPDVQARVFDPFFTTKPVGSGTGLGLHIAFSIVRRHRGTLRVASEPGRTCFRVDLPTTTPAG